MNFFEPKKKSKVYAFVFLSVFLFLFVSCNNSCSVRSSAASGEDASVSVKILSWNLQTFFDSNFDGIEYSQYASASGGWSKEKYEQRLERLAEVVKECSPDIFVMQELENQDQLYDIFNRLCSNFNFSKNYSYGCFAKEKGSAIGIGILSRYPLIQLRLHSLDIRTEKEKMPSVRPLLKVTVMVKEKPLLLMAGHWKSKSGGAEKSEVWRNYQESVLAKDFLYAQKNKIPAIACGDFNRDISEFLKNDSLQEVANIQLRGSENVNVYSPWFIAEDELYEPGSYFYRNTWERIDHFFAGKYSRISDFKVENNAKWTNENGSPRQYFLKNGSGYSDHFPISCTVSW